MEIAAFGKRPMRMRVTMLKAGSMGLALPCCPETYFIIIDPGYCAGSHFPHPLTCPSLQTFRSQDVFVIADQVPNCNGAFAD